MINKEILYEAKKINTLEIPLSECDIIMAAAQVGS